MKNISLIYKITKMCRNDLGSRLKEMYCDIDKNRKRTVFIKETLYSKNGFYYTGDELDVYKNWCDLSKEFKKLKIIDYCSKKKINGVNKKTIPLFTYKNIEFSKNNIIHMDVKKK